jgi:hypothetical protein
MKTKTICFGVACDPIRVVTKKVLTATLVVLLGLSQVPCVCAQDDDVRTKKNADGSVDVYDKDDPNAPDGGEGDSPDAVQGGGGGVRYVPGTSPYTRKYSDGTVVRRNSDGSIETSDPGETSYWGSQEGSGGGSARRRSKKSRVKTVSKTKTTTTKSAGTKTKVQTTTVKKAK